MQNQASGTLERFGQRFSEYLPTLAGGLIVLAIGLVAGWLLKRAVIRILMVLRLDRLAGGQSAWRSAIGKGDVRHALYSAVGTAAGFVLLLVFLNNALQIWGLDVLARMVEALMVYLPTLALATVIVGLGFMLANVLARRVETVLEREDVPRAGLVAGLAKSALLSVVGALALWQLNFAREIVLAAFLIGFGAIGVAFAIGVGIGSARAMQDGWSHVLQKKKDS